MEWSDAFSKSVGQWQGCLLLLLMLLFFSTPVFFFPLRLDRVLSFSVHQLCSFVMLAHWAGSPLLPSPSWVLCFFGHDW